MAHGLMKMHCISDLVGKILCLLRKVQAEQLSIASAQNGQAAVGSNLVTMRNRLSTMAALP